MIINPVEIAAKIRIVSTFMPIGTAENPVSLNPGRHVTLPTKYRRRPVVGGIVQPYKRAVKHVTVGTNSLGYLCGPETEACIPFLIPTKASDPDPENWTVYKLIPDDCYCFHVGNMEFHGEDENIWHPITWGFEVENLGNWRTPVELRQYMKAACIYSYACAVNLWEDRHVYDHSHVAIDHTAAGGRRTDPQAGLWQDSTFYSFIDQFRNQWPWQNNPRLWRGGAV